MPGSVLHSGPRNPHMEDFLGFEPGEAVVVPGLGVGTLTHVEDVPLDTTSERAYRIEFGEGKGRIWVPVERAGEIGLRGIMEEDVAEKAFEVVSSQKAPKKRAHWNRRRRRYEDLLSSNKPREVAALVGELAAVRRVKKGPLSFGERRLLEKAIDLFVAEVSVALGVAKATVEKRLDNAMSSAAAA